ncbi:MAG: formylglycine-generating enzyme family protein [Puniceicoccales bacterium]|jgi:hypothetical protein|nr:formylglycine-generating enzyme family protein [Puniceicoccales bacterium]
MSSLRFCILGTPSTGKSVFLAVLSHALSTRLKPHITSTKKSAYGYVADIVDKLECGEWPAPSLTGQIKSFTWLWHDTPDTSEEDAHQFLTFDCAGEDFAAIFEDAVIAQDLEAPQNADAGLNDKQKDLKKKIFDCNLVLLLFNFQNALDFYDASAHKKKPFILNKAGERLPTVETLPEIVEPPANALHQLHAKGIATCVIFTQEDSYHDAIQTHWNGDHMAALKEVCDKLYAAIKKTGAPAFWISAAKTVNNPTDPTSPKRLPEKTKQTGESLEGIIEQIQNVLTAAAQKEKTRLEQIAIEKAQKEEKEKIIQKEKDDAIKRAAFYGKVFRVICIIIAIAVLAAVAFYGWKQYSTEQGRKATVAAAVTAEQKRKAEQEFRERVSSHKALSLSLSANVSLELLPVAAGSFKMGSENGDSDEKPVHQVTISKPFWLGKTEVTQAQWQAVMGSNPSHFKGADRPVENVSWNDAIAFCKKLNERATDLPAGYEYALPTEAEWEYACRAGSTGDYAGELSSLAWYGENWERGHHEVAKKQPNIPSPL